MKKSSKDSEKPGKSSGEKSIKKSIPIVLDSNEYILGLGKTSNHAEMLLKKAEELNIFISRMMVGEITKNLSEIDRRLVRDFFKLISVF